MKSRVAALTFALLVSLPAPGFAQSAPPIGVRAAGMGGAFTAVADDGTASFWNPAGLASGAFVGGAVDFNSLDRQSGGFAGLVTPPLGFCYYRTTSTGSAASNRNGAVVNQTVHHAGATLVQSIGDHGLAVGSTLKFVHGDGASAFDADAGVMLSGALGQIGLTVHNVFAPDLGDLRLERRVRAGIAVHATQTVTVAADVEFTTTPSPSGDWRDAAAGVEAHPWTRVWLRSGIHWNTAGSTAAPIGTVGGSLTVYGPFRADAQVSGGSKDGDRGWGVGLSFVY